MTHVLLLRTFDPPITVDDVVSGALQTAWCFQLHRVGWHGSFLSAAGTRLCCWFDGPDRESARLALGHEPFDPADLFSCSTREGQVPPIPMTPGRHERVFVEYAFDETIDDSVLRAAEATPSPLACAFVSMDRRRMACVYQATHPDEVAQEQHAAGLPASAVWAAALVNPDMVRSRSR